MKYSFEKKETEIEIKFVIDKEEWAVFYEKTFNKSKNKFSAPGFRKGHVPRKILENLYGGPNFLLEETIEDCFPEVYDKFLEENEGLNIISRPGVTDLNLSEEGEVNITAVASVKPEVILGQYSGLKFKKEPAEITEEEFGEEIHKLLDRHARVITVERAAQSGDEVNINYSGSIDGVKFEGGTAENVNLTIGSGTFIPGFEEQLIGTKEGEEKDIFVKFPDDYRAEELKGKDSTFAVRVNSVKEKELPKFDDEFAKDISEFETAEEYKADMRKKLNERRAKDGKAAEENAMLDAICNNATVPESEYLIDEQAASSYKNFEAELKKQNIKMESYLEYTGMSLEDIREMHRKNAVKTVRNRLVIAALIERAEITAEESDLRARAEEFINEIPNDGNKPSVEEVLSHEFTVNYLKNDILFNKLTDYLRSVNEFE